jgi:serine/threonine protein kinase/WD40 repeat protein
MIVSSFDTRAVSAVDPKLAVLIDELTDRLQAGEAVDLEAYILEHAEHAGPLRQLIPALEMIGELKRSAARDAASPASPERDPRLETGVLGDFRILREIGRGGMGVVYKTEQISLRREVALKVLPFDAAMDTKQLQRFKNEAQAAAHLHHSNIVPVYGVSCERGVHYYAMQYIEGRTVATIIAELRRLADPTPKERDDPSSSAVEVTKHLATGLWTAAGQGGGALSVTETAIGADGALDHVAHDPHAGAPRPAASTTEHSTRKPSYFRTVAELEVQAAWALEYAHSLGVIHRDIKPANLIVDTRGNFWITDFGLARFQGGDELTVTGDLVGTLRYMSPEQALGQRADIDHRADIYSLGMTLYELLTLKPVFGGRDRRELLRQIAFEDPRRLQRLNTAIPSDLEMIVLKAIEKNATERYMTAEALGDDLHRFLDDRPIRARRPTIWDRTRKWARRHWPVVAKAVVAAVFLLAAVGLVASVAAFRFREQLDETRKAQKEGRHRLYEAKLAEAKASPWSGRAGRRCDGLQALGEAATLARDLHLGREATPALRHEAIACMILTDLRIDRQWEGSPPKSGPPVGIAFDSRLERYARVEADGTVTVRGLGDDTVLVHITDVGAPAQRVVDWRVRLRFSPNGRSLAIRSDWHNAVPLQVWDLSGPRRLLSVPACGHWFFQDFDFSPDSRTLATGQADGSIGLYELRSARLLKSLAPRLSPAGLRFDPAGQKLAVCRDGDSTVQILDVAGRASGQTLHHPDHVTTTPAWHADGELLASGWRNGPVYVWNARTGKPVTVCERHQSAVIDVAFSYGGDLLASASWDGTTRLWDPRTGRRLVGADRLAVDFSREDRWLGFELNGPYVGRWEVATGRECRLLRGAEAQGMVHSVDIDRGGLLLASAANDGVHLWDLRTGKEAQVLRLGPTSSVIFDPSGRFLVTSGTAGLYRWPMRWDPDPPAGCLRIGPPRAVNLPPGCRPVQCTQSRDGQRLALHTRSSGEAIFLDLAKPQRRPRFVRANALWCAAISPDGRWIATGTWNGYACKIWDAPTGRCLQELPARNALPAFSPDNRWLVMGTREEYAFHALVGDQWKCSRRQSRDKGAASPGLVAFTRDAQTVALAYSSRSIRLLDTHDWREFATVSAPDSEELTSLCFSPDGSQLAASTRTGRSSSGICAGSGRGCERWGSIGNRRRNCPNSRTTASPFESPWTTASCLIQRGTVSSWRYAPSMPRHTTGAVWLWRDVRNGARPSTISAAHWPSGPIMPRPITIAAWSGHGRGNTRRRSPTGVGPSPSILTTSTPMRRAAMPITA